MHSSNILTFHYDAIRKLLTVTFMSLGKYEYSDVKYETYDDFLRSKSKGQYFDMNIKGKHPEKKIY